jgi:hypothetical protein
VRKKSAKNQKARTQMCEIFGQKKSAKAQARRASSRSAKA